MSGALAAVGWPLAAALALAVAALLRRLELVARAEHELRGPAGVLFLAVERMRRDPAAQRHATALEPELARLGTALADLTAARRGRRAPARPRAIEPGSLAERSLGSWAPALRAAGRDARVSRSEAATVHADGGRVAQVLCNLIANAAEHGSGPVEVRSRREGDALALEVRSGGGLRADRPAKGRGRGLAIARDAARGAGGWLRVREDRGTVVAALELPVAEAPDGGDGRPARA